VAAIAKRQEEEEASATTAEDEDESSEGLAEGGTIAKEAADSQ
jgi:hypothetical protein